MKEFIQGDDQIINSNQTVVVVKFNIIFYHTHWDVAHGAEGYIMGTIVVIPDGDGTYKHQQSVQPTAIIIAVLYEEILG